MSEDPLVSGNSSSGTETVRTDAEYRTAFDKALSTAKKNAQNGQASTHTIILEQRGWRQTPSIRQTTIAGQPEKGNFTDTNVPGWYSTYVETMIDNNGDGHNEYLSREQNTYSSENVGGHSTLQEKSIQTSRVREPEERNVSQPEFDHRVTRSTWTFDRRPESVTQDARGQQLQRIDFEEYTSVSNDGDVRETARLGTGITDIVEEGSDRPPHGRYNVSEETRLTRDFDGDGTPDTESRTLKIQGYEQYSFRRQIPAGSTTTNYEYDPVRRVYYSEEYDLTGTDGIGRGLMFSQLPGVEKNNSSGNENE